MANNHFPNDGRNDRKARASERDLCEWLNVNANRKMIYPDLSDDVYAKHIGGKNGKDDVSINEYNSNKVLRHVSNKHKKEISTGTFDWTNDSSWTRKQILNNLQFSAIQDFCNMPKKNVTRALYYQASFITLTNFSDELIRNILQTLMIDKCLPQDIFVTVPSANKIYFFPFSKHSINKLIIEKGKFFLRGKTEKAKQSLSVFFQYDDGKVIDTGLRFRLHINNGITKYKEGKSVSWCLKIQQDSHDEVLNISEVYDYK